MIPDTVEYVRSPLYGIILAAGCGVVAILACRKFASREGRLRDVFPAAISIVLCLMFTVLACWETLGPKQAMVLNRAGLRCVGWNTEVSWRHMALLSLQDRRVLVRGSPKIVVTLQSAFIERYPQMRDNGDPGRLLCDLDRINESTEVIYATVLEYFRKNI